MMASAFAFSMIAGGGTVLPQFEGMSVFAAEEEADRSMDIIKTVQGVANFGSGTSSITIHGKQNQSLLHKRFMVYRLFDVSVAEKKDSAHYTFNPEYEEAIKTVVSRKTGIPADRIDSDAAADYLVSISGNEKYYGFPDPEESAEESSARPEQEREGHYSKFLEVLEEIRDEIAEDKEAGTEVFAESVEPQSNSIRLSGLLEGFYMIDEVTSQNGVNTLPEDSAASLLLSLTAYQNVSINLKSDYPRIEKQVQEDDRQDEIGADKDGWNDVGDFETGQPIPYRYNISVPNISGYDSYGIAMEDQMHEALDLDPDSISVHIRKGERDIALKPEDITLTQDKDKNHFEIAVPKLKEILDREWADELDKNKEAPYGQTIQVSYNASLNDKAIKDTGRPGYENKVRLRYPSNPDSNGNGEYTTTVWNTTVVFTFSLDATKVNTEGTRLSDARFRLYNDEACKSEVYVRQVSAGHYAVIHTEEKDPAPQKTDEIVSDADGNFTISGLDSQTYYLKETQAPDGYTKLKGPIAVVIDAAYTKERNSLSEDMDENALEALSGTANLTMKEGIGQEYEIDYELNTSPESGSVALTIPNEQGSTLPITGGMYGLIFAGGAGLMAVSLVAVTAGGKRKKRKKDRK